MNRLLFPALVLIIATTAILLVTGQTSVSLVPPARGHEPADYGSGPVQPLTPPVNMIARLPGHDPADYADQASDRDTAQLERGKYLANRVALCIDCHTPHDQQGQPLMEQHLHGSPIPFKPTIPMPWAEVSPRIAGMVVFNEAHVRSVLTTGKRPDGSMPLPPMPPYQLAVEDADAIIAYLKTLP